MPRNHSLLFALPVAVLGLAAVAPQTTPAPEVQVTPRFHIAPLQVPLDEPPRLLPHGTSVVPCPEGAFPDEPTRRLIEGPLGVITPAVPVLQTGRRPGMELVLPDGRRVLVPPDFDRSRLQQQPCIDFVGTAAAPHLGDVEALPEPLRERARRGAARAGAAQRE